MSDDNNNLIPWNPAHFGHVNFQKEPDGQLTIFFEDAHEPPDPDYFTNLEAYKIAWTAWEQTQTLPQREEIMNFNITTSFDTEIEQLKARLAELETQKHRVSTCANRIVTQVGECVIEMKQVGVSDEILTDWACVIYKEITGEDVPALSDSDVLKGVTAWEEKYKQLLAITSKQIDQLTTERDELLNKPQETNELSRIGLLKKVSDLTIERDTALQKYTDLTVASLRVSDELNISKKTILELTTDNQKLTEEVLELRGESPHTILKEPATLAETQTEESEEDPRQDPEFLEATKNQEIIAEFLKKLDRIARVDKLTWRKIRELPLNSETMRELGLQVNPKSKIHKYLLEQMPVMCARYIEETGDNSDLDWLPGHFVESVREALSVAEETESEETDPPSEVKPVFQRGDIVCLTANPSSQAKILDINGEWLNVQDSDGLTDMWNISDVLVAE